MTLLYINDNNIDILNRCNPLEVIKISVEADMCIDFLLNNLYKFINLQELDLSQNKITEIKGLSNLVALQKLYLNNNQIGKIEGLDKLVNLKILDISKNNIKEIKGLSNLVALQKLYLYENKIIEIKGLENLINLKELYLNYNEITEIKELDNLTNLKYLNLQENEIKEIKGLDNLINLKKLYLNYNQITEIKGLSNLVALKDLCLNINQITEIKGLDKLVNLRKLHLNANQISEIKRLDNLFNLQELYLNNNQITEIPISLCNFRNINIIQYYDNPIEHIPLPVQRWLDRLNRRVTSNNMVYKDSQNVHNHHIQNSFRNSLTNLLKDKPTITLQIVKHEIINSDILIEQSKREILNYCDDKTEHSTYLITYSDLLIYVWSRIIKSRHKDEILKVLNQEINDGLCMCFTGRMTRLLNTLVGFYDDIELQISDSEQITNIIMSLKNKITDGEQLKEAVKKELVERQYSETIINEWLEYI